MHKTIKTKQCNIAKGINVTKDQLLSEGHYNDRSTILDGNRCYDYGFLFALLCFVYCYIFKVWAIITSIVFFFSVPVFSISVVLIIHIL